VIAAGVLAVLGVVAAGGPLNDPYWVKLSTGPSEDDLYCAGYDHLRQWSVSLQNGQPIAARHRVSERLDPLPFAVPKGEDRSGSRQVLKVPGGWLAGFDAGEFGGGLWFTDGKKWTRVRPPADAPSAAEDPFRAENVQGLVAFRGGEVMVLMGLDHLTGRSGRIFAATPRQGGYSLVPRGVLDSSPGTWLIADDQLEVLTDGGLWRVSPRARAEQTVSLDLSRSYPSSLVAGPDGARYIGMRRYVLVLKPSDGTWKQTWYAPADCPRSTRDDRWNCSCLK
jgi:hypothetical protein